MAPKAWKSLLTNPPKILLFTYHAGGGPNPNGPYKLVLHVNGSAKLDNDTKGMHRSWAGRVSDATVRQLMDALREANFPEAPEPPEQPEPNTKFRSLTVAGDDSKGVIQIEDRRALSDSPYRPAFEILDSIVHQLSDSVLEHAQNKLGQVVSDIKRIE